MAFIHWSIHSKTPLKNYFIVCENYNECQEYEKKQIAWASFFALSQQTDRDNENCMKQDGGIFTVILC